MSRPLTKQQQIVYDFIREQIVSRGYGPTVREIGEHMNIKSPNGVMCHLRALERKGTILRRANKSRAIELTEPISRMVDATIPVGGSVNSGACLLGTQPTEQLNLGKLCDDSKFALEVSDDSMLDAHIRAGDMLVIRRQPLARHGQLAIVRTGDSETCLRFWMNEGSRIRLQPATRSVTPTMVEHAEVLGVVVAVLRDLIPEPVAQPQVH